MVKKKNKKKKIEKREKTFDKDKIREQNKIRHEKREARMRINKRNTGIVAVILAIVTVIYGFYYFVYKTDYFNISSIKIDGNSVYSNEYIADKTKIRFGQNLFSINRNDIKENIEKESYIEKCLVSYYLPNKIMIKIKEREDKYIFYSENMSVIADENGYALEGKMKDKELIEIACIEDIDYIYGEKINIAGIENFDMIGELYKYTIDKGVNDKFKKILINKNNVLDLTTKYDMIIRLELNENFRYHIDFGLEIQKTRLKEGSIVEDCIVDFTKGENPVFSFETDN